MPKEPRFRADGQPDNRGRSEGSRAHWFAPDDGRKRPGRGKGSKSLKTVYQAVAEIPVKADIQGKARRISTKEGIILKEREQALKGDHRAREHFLKRVAEYSPMEVEPDRTAALLVEDADILASAFERGLLGVLPLGSETPEASADGEQEAVRPPREQP